MKGLILQVVNYNKLNLRNSMNKITNHWLALILIHCFVFIKIVNSSCLESCQNCSSSLVCLQCTSSNYIVISSKPSKGCLPCKPGCKTCSSQYSSCSTCVAGYYMDINSYKCLACQVANCETCQQLTPDICTNCSLGYFLVESSGTCQACSIYSKATTCRQNIILTCQPGYFVSGGQKCLPCGLNCLKCSSSSFCMACADGYFGSNCSLCHPSCQTCIKSTACITCKSGYYLNGSLCSICDFSKNFACVSCDLNGDCTKCLPTYYLDSQKICVQVIKPIKGCIRYEQSISSNLTVICKECQLGSFLSSTGSGLCMQCSLVCSNCSGMYSSSGCTSCSIDYGIALTSSICTYRAKSLKSNIKNIYLSQWNYPTNYSYLGSNISVINSNCPSWKFTSKVRVKIGMINGNNIKYAIKLTLSIQNTVSNSLNYTIGLNNLTISQVVIPESRNLQASLWQCSQNISSATTQFTQYLKDYLPSDYNFSLLAPYNQQLPDNSNLLQIWTSSPGLFIAVSQIIFSFKQCFSSCALCNNDGTCILCKDKLYKLQQEKCVSACDQFFYLNGSRCLKICPEGTYHNQYLSVWTCSLCQKQCTRCQSISSCISCSLGYFLFESTCINKCPDEYFANNISQRCEPCSQPCFKCNSSKLCLSCSYNFLFNNSCVSASQCPSGFFANLMTMQCTKCIDPCLECSSLQLCKSCLPSYGYLFNSKCFPSCPPGYIPNNISYTCDKCASQCLTCKNQINHCTSCSRGFLLDGHCISNCPDGLYQNYTTMECNLCQSPCQTCRFSALSCKSCLNGYIIHEQLGICLLQKQCLGTSKSFLNSKTVITTTTVLNVSTTKITNIKLCTYCPEQCLSCSNSTICLTCISGRYLLNSSCLMNCPFGYFNDKNNLICRKCSSNCATCLNQQAYCTSCQMNYRLNDFFNCQTGCLLKNQLSPTCEKCNEPCYTCQIYINRCLSCIQGYYFNNATHQCLQRCYDGFYASHSTKMCLRCGQSCLTCINETNQCTSCPGSTYLVLKDLYFKSGECMKTCPSRFYPAIKSLASQMCEPCIQPCLQCAQTGTKCLSCLKGVLNVDECIPECPYEKYLNKINNSCENCYQRCLNCFGPLENECYSCKPGYYFLQQQLSCVRQCPSSYVSSNISFKCQYCQFPCRQCVNQTTKCTKCWQQQNNSSDSNILVVRLYNFYLYEHQCLKSCPSQTYSVKDICLQCKSPCKQCLSEDICLSCQTDKYYLLNQCIQNCPDGYFPDDSSMSCRNCQYPCKTCISQTACLSCIDGVRIMNSCSMIDSCPSGQYLQYKQTNGLCQVCSPECLECIDRADKCTICRNSSLILYNFKCTQVCPSSFYKMQSQVISQANIRQIINICALCPSQCSECSSYENCSQCVVGFDILNNKCIQVCPPSYFHVSSQGNKIGGICEACSNICKTCVNFNTNCLSCYNGYFLHQFNCLAECPAGTYIQPYTDYSQTVTNYASLLFSLNISMLIDLLNPNQTDQYNQTLIDFILMNLTQHLQQLMSNSANLTGNQLISGVCRECIFPCRQCLNSQLCVHCLSGFYLFQGLCIEKCRKPFFTLETPSDIFCIQSCPSDYKFVLDYENHQKCSLVCQFPYLLSADKTECLVSCPQYPLHYVNSNFQCMLLSQKTTPTYLTQASIAAIVDKQYNLKLNLIFNSPVNFGRFNEFRKQEDLFKIQISNSFLYQNKSHGRFLQREMTGGYRMLQGENSQINLQYKIIELASNYMMIQLNPQSFQGEGFPTSDSYISMEFWFNSHLLIKNSLSQIPLQSASYLCLMPYYEAYPSNFQVSLYFSVFGEVLVVFLLIISFMLLIFNWFAKVYESMHFCQLVFLLSVLEIQYPPNLWLFFQGFKNIHWYFVKNWFVSQKNLFIYSQSPPKISAIFVDSNFIRICGHILCLLIIASAIVFILFLSKFFVESKNERVSKISKTLNRKFKLVKWSHIHDLVMVTTMITVFGFLVQMHDYSPKSTLQILGIILSYLTIIALAAYYIYMAYKLYKIVALSQEDPRRFCDKKYLFRDNMLSITQSAVHPKQLYLNYLRAARIIAFGGIIGSFSISPMLCIGSILTILLVSALVYLLSKPYPDNLQNILLGLADISTMIAIFFICLIQFLTVNFDNVAEYQTYLAQKWRLGWVSIIFFLITAFLLLAQLLISIVKGNSSPMKLAAEDSNKIADQILLGAPKFIEVSPKNQFLGWQANQNGKSTGFGFKYQIKQI